MPVVDRRQLLSYVLCHIALVDYFAQRRKKSSYALEGIKEKGDNLGGNIIIQA